MSSHPFPTRSRQRLHRRPGQTMLELVAATTIIAVALVPALRLTGRGLDNLTRIERFELATTWAASLMEEEMARTAATWDLTERLGDLAHLGNPELRYRVLKSDRATAGGIPQELAVLEVTVWHDQDGGSDLDPDEPRTQFHTKLARVASYERRNPTE
ncbi:MAG: hypothetical protein KatS3mg111_3210 [Pirellulaceae bacterium]|nr:MAG: hypothetical protein KatS3mg111_3210 [Pirellulaceae bacterium]